MKILTLLIILFIVGGCNTHNKNSATLEKKWKEIISEKGNFRIQFPDYEIKQDQTTYLYEEKENIIYFYSINTQDKPDSNLGYRIDFSFMPEITTRKQIEEKFSEQRDYVISAANATLEYEAKIDTLGCQARQFYFTIDGKKIKTTYRMLFRNGILYKLMVITPEGKLFNNSISRFLDSFKFLEEK